MLKKELSDNHGLVTEALHRNREKKLYSKTEKTVVESKKNHEVYLTGNDFL